MKQLYCPWREQYSADDGRSKQQDTSTEECVFCAQFRDKHDDDNFIIKRFDHCIMMLNKYPYNAGHLLIIPKEHCSDLSQLSTPTRNELMELTTKAVTVVREHIGAQGANIGLNIGKIAGAGIPSHLHMHVVPRYHGDTNFMVTIAETKTVSFDLANMLKKLRHYF
jgi:ATP adenylyltransferase